MQQEIAAGKYIYIIGKGVTFRQGFNSCKRCEEEMNKILALSLLFAVAGCASITGEKLQPVSVQTIQDDKEVAGIGCTLTNDEGRWFVTTPGSVTVHKSTGDLSVDCKKDGNIAGHETLVSKSNGAVWGNILVGGGIGYIIDRNTGAGFNYPNTITVMLRKIGEAVGVTPSNETPKNRVSQQSDSQPIQTAATDLSANETSETTTPINSSQKLRELHALRNDGLITEDDYQKKKQSLLDKL